MGDYENAFIKCFIKMDTLLGSADGKKEMIEINKNSNVRQSPLMQILKGDGGGGESLDDIALDSKGCTANVVMIKDNVIYCANSGDSRAVVCSDGVAENLSEDHKPDNKIEKDRIYKAGSVV